MKNAKRKHSMLTRCLALLLCVLMLPWSMLHISAGAAVESTLLQEDFEKRSSVYGPQNEWTMFAGSMPATQEENGNHYWDTNGVTSFQAQTHVADESWKNYAVQMDFQVDAWAGGTYDAVIIRARFIDDWHNYQFIVRRKTGQLELVKRTETNVQTNVADPVSYTLETGAWYTMKMEFADGNVNAYLAKKGEDLGEPVISGAQDATLSYGGVEIYNAGADARFDNITVSTVGDAAENGGALLREDFGKATSTYGPQNEWTMFSGTMPATQEENGNYYWDTNGGTTFQAQTHVADESWTDYSVQMDFQVDAWAGGTWDAVIIRARLIDDWHNYQFIVRRKTGQLELVKRTAENVQENLANPVSYAFETGAWYTMKIEFVDGNVNGYLAKKGEDLGEPVISGAQDATLSYGGVEIYNAGADARFDNIKVSSANGDGDLLVEDFGKAINTYGPQNEWTMFAGTMPATQEENGNPYWDTNGVTSFQAQTHVADESWTDYAVQMDFQVDAWAGGTYDAVIIRARLIDDWHNYQFIVRRRTGQLELVNRSATNVQTTLKTVPYAFETGKWYTMKMEFIGTTINCYIAEKGQPLGEPVMTAVDYAVAYGGVEVYNAGADARYDNILVFTDTLLHEDLEKEAEAYGPRNEWTMFSGTMPATQEENENHYWDTNGVANFQAQTHVADESWKDYSVQMDFQVDAWAGGTWDAVIIRARLIDDWHNYQFIVRRKTGQLELVKRTAENVQEKLADPVSYTFETGAWYTMKIEFVDGNVNGYLAKKGEDLGEPVISGAQDAAVAYGGVEIYNAGADVRIDNIAVSAIMIDKPARDEVYVSTEGSDETGDGSLEKPYQTIAAAQSAVRSAIKEGLTKDAYIYIMGGTYYLNAPIQIGAEDYDETYKVIYQNYNNEEVTVLGGEPVTGWTDPDGDGIYEADVTGRNDFYALFDGGKRMTSAKATNWQGITVQDKSHLQAVYGSATSWFGEVLKVASLDGGNMTTQYDRASFSGSLEYLQGAKEYIDEAGEWAIQGDKVYYKPADPTTINNGEIIAAVSDHIFNLEGTEAAPVKNIVIDGLQLAMTDFGENLLANGGRSPAGTIEEACNLQGIVNLKHTEHITVQNCKLTNAGYLAVSMQGYTQNNTVYGNYIEGSGYAGIFLFGENWPSLNYINKNNTISNNRIKNVGEFVGHGSGIYLVNSGENTITHNVISDVPRYGISMKGTRYGTFSAGGLTNVPYEEHYQYNQTTGNYIGYNLIYNTGKRSADGGGIESWGSGRDNWLDHNIVYNAYRSVATTGWRGHSFFLDDASNHFVVTNNISYDENAVAANDGVMMKSVDNFVANNVFDVSYEYNGAAYISHYVEPTSGLTFDKNIMYSAATGTLNKNGTWTEAGNGDRSMVTINEGAAEFGNLVSMDNNLYFNAVGKGTILFNGSNLSLEELQNHADNIAGFEANSVYADPMFVDVENRNYGLKNDSPAKDIGILPIEAADIGLLADFRYADANDTKQTLYVKAADDAQAEGVVAVGETMQLASYYRTKNGYLVNATDVTYTSDNTAVATVDASGKVTALAKGTAVITVSGNGMKDEIAVYVGDEAKNLVAEDVNLMTNSNALAWVGVAAETAEGNIVVPEDVQYKSNNTDVVTVENGLLKAQGSGETTVTITAEVNGKTVTKDIAVNVNITDIDLYEKTPAKDATTLGSGAKYNGTTSNGETRVAINPDSYIVFNGVDFEEGAKRFTAIYETGSASSVGDLELRLGAVDGELVGTIDLELNVWGVPTQSWIDVDPDKVNGIQDLYVVSKSGVLNLLSIQFSKYEAGEQKMSIAIDGADIVGAPQDGTLEHTFTAVILDDLDYRNPVQDVTWSLNGTYQNITINENGTLTVGIPERKEQTLIISAVWDSDPTRSAEKEIVVYDGTIVDFAASDIDEMVDVAAEGDAFSLKNTGCAIFEDVDLKNGIDKYQVELSRANAAATVSLRTGSQTGEVFSTISGATGAWNNWAVFEQTVTGESPAGVNDLVLTTDQNVNIRWLRLFLPNKRVDEPVAVAKIGEVEYTSVAEALAVAKSGETVTLVADAEESYVIVTPGVTLDLGAHTLTADYVIGLKGSHITGAVYATNGSAYGRLVVAKDNVALSSEPCKVNTSNGDRYVLPVWDDNADGYVFGRYMINENPSDEAPNRGFVIDAENDQLSLVFKHKGTAATNGLLKDDGSSNNGVTFLVRITWVAADGDVVSQDYSYSDANVIASMKTGEEAKDFGITFTGYSSCTNIKVTAMMVSDTGVEVVGETHEVN